MGIIAFPRLLLMIFWCILKIWRWWYMNFVWFCKCIFNVFVFFLVTCGYVHRRVPGWGNERILPGFQQVSWQELDRRDDLELCRLQYCSRYRYYRPNFSSCRILYANLDEVNSFISSAIRRQMRIRRLIEVKCEGTFYLLCVSFWCYR